MSGRIRINLRRTLSLALAGSYLVCAVGFAPSYVGFRPAPGAVVERFPCETHACGCLSANACETRCCCYTPAQRRAWALREGLTPPVELTVVVAESGGCCGSSESSEETCPAPSGPAFTPFGCQGLQLTLVAVPAPPSFSFLSVAEDAPPRVIVFKPAQEVIPQSRSLLPDPPPPRFV